MVKAIGICMGLVLVVTVTGCPPARCAGPDPQATAINYTLLSTTTSTSGDVRITGVVTNRGMESFLSSQGQQAAYLYEGSELVATQEFINLAVDATVEVSYERNWSTQDEFRPPSYTVLIAYDPDIYIDGNDNNDDCNSNNNDFARGTSGLDDLFTP